MSKLNLHYQTLISAGLVLLLATAIWVYTATFPELDDGYPGPALFPRLVAIGLGLCGVLLIIEQFTSESKSTPKKDEIESANIFSWLRLLGGFASMIMFPYLYDYIGFIPALGISCFCMALLLRVRPLRAIAVAAGAAIVIYLLFTKLLSVPL